MFLYDSSDDYKAYNRAYVSMQNAHVLETEVFY